MQTIWAVPPGIALTDSDSTVITGLTKSCKWKSLGCQSNTVKHPFEGWAQVFQYYLKTSYNAVSFLTNEDFNGKGLNMLSLKKLICAII